MSRYLFYIGVLLTVIVIVVDGYLSVRFFGRLADAALLRHQSLVEIYRLESYLSTIKDAETGERGYLLTGKPEYLEPFNAAVANLNSTETQDLLKQVEAQPKFSDKVQQLRKLVTEKLEVQNNVLEIFKKSGFEEAQKKAKEDTGKSLMDQIRSQVDVILVQKLKDFEEQEAELKRWFVLVLKGILAVNIVYALAMTLCLFFLFRRADEADEAEEEAKEKNEIQK